MGGGCEITFKGEVLGGDRPSPVVSKFCNMLHNYLRGAKLGLPHLVAPLFTKHTDLGKGIGS